MGSNCSTLFSMILRSIFFMIFVGGVVEGSKNSMNIGAIVDVGTRVGKEQKTAMVMAADYFNNFSRNHKLIIHFREISNDPIQAALSAEELIREDQVQVIVGLQTWEQATMVANVGRRAQVPVLSLTSTVSAASKVTQLRWPFLVPIMPHSSSEQMDCIAAIVQFYSWRKVIVIYEENVYGTGDSEVLAQLSGALQTVGAEIESYLGLPPPSSLFDSETVVREEVAKLLRRQSRVFIILQESLPLASNLFKEAKQMGLMGRDSAWIISDALSDLLDSVDTSFINSAQGALGIKKYYSEDTGSYQEFRGNFQKNFRSEYPDEPNYLEPGIHALRAYDAITAVHKATENLGKTSTNTSVALLSKILASNFTGLTGGIHFHRAESLETSIFRVINVVGKSYRELGFWSPGFGFSEKLEIFKNGSVEQNMKKLKVVVNWPGELNRTPKGWAMPTDAKPMRIGVPGRAAFEKFVKVEWADKPEEIKYDGFCIRLFQEVLGILQENYDLPYEFHPYNGTYDDLVNHVITKKCDAAIGDITILANRSRYVEFTQPFAESGLSMLVPVKHDFHIQKAWMFLKPFTPNLWYATYGSLFYTMLVIWLIERNSDNKQFQGRLKDELGTSLWFTFSSLFFAHREAIKSNLTRAVVVVWLFLVFVLSSSYTASLTSMLTVPRLEPRINDLEWIRRTNAAVGCDGDSFVKAYLRDVIGLTNIKNINNQDDYPGELESGSIAAAFLELPYQEIFLEDH